MGARVIAFLVLFVVALPQFAIAQEGLGTVDRAMVAFDAKPLFEVRGVSALPAAERARVIRDRLIAAAEESGFRSGGNRSDRRRRRP